MINLKKSLIAALLISCASFSLYGQSVENVSENEATDYSQIRQEETKYGIDTGVVSSDSDNDNSENQLKKSPSSIGVFVRMIIVLIVVVVLVYLVFYFIKKKTNVVKNDDDYLRRAAYINIAPGKTVEVITLIDKAYLIGVTEGSITLLGEIDDDELIKAMNITADKKNNTKKPSTFSEVLDMFTSKGKKQKNVFEESENQVKNIGIGEETEE